MTCFEKLRSLFTNRKRLAKRAALSRPNAAPRHTTPNDGSCVVHHPSPESSGDSEADPYGALSEIACPEPVERLPEEELARHPSLEQGLSSKGHGMNEDEDYWALSEIAAPEPVERRSDEEMARHPSLERRLSHVSRRRLSHVSRP